MSKKITADEVADAEAALAEAKKGKDPAKRQAAAEHVTQLRLAWRRQEEAAGRRTGLVAVTDEES